MSFWSLLVTLGPLFLIFKGPVNRLEFRWILGPPLGHPKSRAPGQVMVSVLSGGPACYQLITNWLILKQLTAATRAGYQGFQQPGLDIRDSKHFLAAVCPPQGGAGGYHLKMDNASKTYLTCKCTLLRNQRNPY